jgi:hypothetical protein
MEESQHRAMRDSGFEGIEMNQQLLSDLMNSNDRLLEGSTAVPTQSNTPQFGLEQPLNAVDIQKSLLKHQEQIQHEIHQQQQQNLSTETVADLSTQQQTITTDPNERQNWQAMQNNVYSSQLAGFANNNWSDMNGTQMCQQPIPVPVANGNTAGAMQNGNIAISNQMQPLQEMLPPTTVAQSLQQQMKQNQVVQQQAMMEAVLQNDSIHSQQYQDVLSQQAAIQQQALQQQQYQEAMKQQAIQAQHDMLKQEALKQQQAMQEALNQQVLKEQLQKEALIQQQALQSQQDNLQQTAIQNALNQQQQNMMMQSMDSIQQQILMNPVPSTKSNESASPVKEESKPHDSIHNPFVGVDPLQSMKSVLVQPLQVSSEPAHTHRRTGSQTLSSAASSEQPPHLAIHLLQQQGSLKPDLNSPHSPFVNSNDPLLSVFSNSNQVPQVDTPIKSDVADQSSEVESLQKKVCRTYLVSRSPERVGNLQAKSGNDSEYGCNELM